MFHSLFTALTLEIKLPQAREEAINSSYQFLLATVFYDWLTLLLTSTLPEGKCIFECRLALVWFAIILKWQECFCLLKSALGNYLNSQTETLPNLTEFRLFSLKWSIFRHLMWLTTFLHYFIPTWINPSLNCLHCQCFGKHRMKLLFFTQKENSRNDCYKPIDFSLWVL